MSNVEIILTLGISIVGYFLREIHSDFKGFVKEVKEIALTQAVHSERLKNLEKEEPSK